MKRSFALIVLSAILFLTNNSCKKENHSMENTYMNDAIITGPDFRACICCGGLMITFNGETRPYTGDFRLINTDNSVDLGITNNDTFPIYVKVDWKEDTTNVCHDITITRVARR